MKTPDELRSAFAVYFHEMKRCEDAGTFWALLHLAVALPDICAALEAGLNADVGNRYISWCAAHFPADQTLTPVDRYQIRNAILHEGSTLPLKSQYASVSFVEPGVAGSEVHQNVEMHPGGKNLTLDVKRLADETRAAIDRWFQSLQVDPERNNRVELRLTRLARFQTKVAAVPITTSDGEALKASDGQSVVVTIEVPTVSST